MKMEFKDYIIIAIIIMAGLGAAYQYFDSVKTGIKAEKMNKELIEKSDSLAKAYKENAKLQEQISQKTDSINEKAKSIIESSVEIIEQQKKTIDAQENTIKMVHGFGYSRILITSKKQRHVNLIIESASDYIMYDGGVDMMKMNNVPKIQIGNEHYITKDVFQKEKIIGLITYNSLNSEGWIDVDYEINVTDEPLFFEFITHYRHTKIIQYSIIYWMNDKIQHEYKIFQIVDGDFEFVEQTLGPKKDEDIWEKRFFFKQKYKLLMKAI